MKKLLPAAALMFLLAIMLSPLLARANDEVRIGVLADRSLPAQLTRWDSFRQTLNQAIPGYDFNIYLLPQQELEDAVSSRSLDFIITNPGHYISLLHRYGLSSTLATIIKQYNGQPLNAFGGVIFSKKNPAYSLKLQAVKNRTIATVGKESLGGFQLQAFELLNAGMAIPADNKLVITGFPHDNVVKAVLEGRADLGFVSTGILETMAAEGKIELAQIEIINQQKLPGFPFAASTPLYPEWPVASLPHVDSNLTRQVVGFLLSLPQGGEAVTKAGLYGFEVPANYSAIETMARELRLPPFDLVPRFTLTDVWNQYRLSLIGLIFFMVIMTASLVLLLHLKQANKTNIKLQQALGAAEEANKAKTYFLANMSHELRTPMHAISSFTALALKHRLDDKTARYLQNIRVSANRLTVLLDDLLDLSKLESGRTVVTFKPNNLTRLVKAQLETLNSLLQDKSMSVLLDAPEKVAGEFDDKLIGQVILNMLSNAIKFSPPGARLHIIVAAETRLINDGPQKILKLSVIDQGHGIPIEDLDAIFDKFVQSSRNHSKAGGTGLGLAICKEIIELHNGRIWAESPVKDDDKNPDNENQPGAAFHIELPAVQLLSRADK